MDLTLNGSFADMVLIPKSGISEISSTDVVFVLTNPGQLHVYEGSKLFNLSQEQVPSFRPKNFPLTVPTIEPCISAAKHYFLPIDENNLKTLLEVVFYYSLFLIKLNFIKNEAGLAHLLLTNHYWLIIKIYQFFFF